MPKLIRSRKTLLLALTAALALIAGGWWLTRSRAPAPEVRQTVAAGGLELTIELDRAQIGERTIVLVARDSTGGPADVDGARLRFSMAEMDMGQVEAELQPAGPGRFVAGGSFFSMVGRWLVEATVLKGGQPVATAPFDLIIAAPGEVAGPLNPLASDPQAVSAGRALYLANCAACHGETGRGDGPDAARLARRPADLTQHLLPGLHTDGQIFAWVKEGVPGSPMPAFGASLSDEQIWQVVAFLRTFSPAVAQPAAPYPAPAVEGGVTVPAPPPVQQPAYPVPAMPAPTVTAGIPDAPEPPPPLIFARESTLWRSDGDGRAPRPLLTPAADQYAQHPALSPDGSRLAYVLVTYPTMANGMSASSYALSTSAADGTDARVVWQPEAGALQMPAWAPDGRSIFVTLSGEGEGGSTLGILRVDLASGARTLVVADALDPAVSPDGSQLAYLRLRPDGATLALEVAALDGSGARTLIDGAGFQALYAPRFSPDGRRIVVAAVGGPESGSAGSPRPSRGGLGATLAALLEPPPAAAHGVPWDLWEVRLDGGGLRRLAALGEDLPMAAFSPDGTRIAVVAEGGIYLMGGDGDNLRRIDRAGGMGGVVWLHVES
ncbi:MAG TPA: c-type cytochrome [Roseiflexaceae bacterium]|nr:c-type cytochrome [Roseiflexaceae bacterium]